MSLFDDLSEIHEAFRRGLIWKNASQIHFHQFYNLLRDVCYKKLPCTWVAVSAVLLSIYWQHLDIVGHIEFKNAFPQIRSRERKFEQRLAPGLFWSRLSNLITIPDCLSDVYISENAEWIAEEFSLVIGQRFNHNIENYEIILTQTRTFED